MNCGLISKNECNSVTTSDEEVNDFFKWIEIKYDTPNPTQNDNNDNEDSLLDDLL